MKGNGNKKENKRSLNKPMGLNKPIVSRDIPLPKTLPADLKPYDTNNDGVLDYKEKRSMELKKRSQDLLKKEREDRRGQAVEERKKGLRRGK